MQDGTSAEIQMLIEANSKPRDIVIYAYGSVSRNQSAWGFTEKLGKKDKGAFNVTSSSLTM